MKCQRLISLASALALAPIGAFSATAIITDAPPPPKAAPFDATSQLLPPVRGVVKMLDSGVAEDVIKAYIQDAPSPFNLTPDDIIQLQEMGVSDGLTAAMLKHDKTLRENLPPAPYGPPPTTGAVSPPPTATPQVSDYDVYNNLYPYGSWADLPGYGWGWQPY